MTAPSLTADCTRCAALCCIALAFDRGAMFAFDKEAGEPCRNLDAAGRCRIHESLADSGFRGCVAYDCHGAGQHVTQGLFGGASWRDDPQVLAPMMRALADLKPLHEVRLLIAEALKMALPDHERRALLAYEARLAPEAGWTLGQIDSGAVRALVAEVRQHFQSLRAYAPGAR